MGIALLGQAKEGMRFGGNDLGSGRNGLLIRDSRWGHQHRSKAKIDLPRARSGVSRWPGPHQRAIDCEETGHLLLATSSYGLMGLWYGRLESASTARLLLWPFFTLGVCVRCDRQDTRLRTRKPWATTLKLGQTSFEWPGSLANDGGSGVSLSEVRRRGIAWPHGRWSGGKTTWELAE